MIFRILLIFFGFIYAKEYYISFRFSSVNSFLYDQNFNCSKTIQKYKCNKKLLFTLPLKKSFSCKNYKSEIVNKLLKENIRVFSVERKYEGYDFKNVITFTPKLFDIIIKNKKIYFYECKE
jgi:hypothetical protein